MRTSRNPEISDRQLLPVLLSSVAEPLRMPPRWVSATALLHPDPIGRACCARELGGGGAAEVVEHAELDELGQAVSRAGWSLICDLSSPIALGSEPCYRLGQIGDACASSAGPNTYRWAVRRRSDGRPIWQAVTTAPEIRIVAAAPGSCLVEVSILADGVPTGVRLWLEQEVERVPEALTSGLQEVGAAAAEALRELVTELRPYIIDAAAATGPGGITARLLASVLLVEVLRCPKAAREGELFEVGELLAALGRGERVLLSRPRLDRRLGVGQLRPMTAAMVLGVTPWPDREVGDRGPAADAIEDGHDTLPLETRREIFTQLRWPKSNIALAARLLDASKHRSSRHAALTRAQLAADPQAVACVAAEYAGGGSLSSPADEQPSSYGARVWQQMWEPLVQRFFPDD